MSNRQTEWLLFVVVAFVAGAMVLGPANAQSSARQRVTSSPSPPPTPSNTPSVQQTLDAVETRVADLDKRMSISSWRQKTDIAQNIAVVLAAACGGGWTLWLFQQHRQRFPRARIAHRITHRQIGDGRLLLHVEVVVSNIGDVLVSVISLETTVHRMFPMQGEFLDGAIKGENRVPGRESEIAWPLIDSDEQEWNKGDCEIEPAESQQILHDFIFDADDVTTVQVYSHVENERKRDRELGWELSTIYNLDDTEDPPCQQPGR